MKTSPRYLVLDSATQYLYIGLYDGVTRIADHYVKGHNDHSVTLMPALDKLLRSQHIEMSEIDVIVIGDGPGSYTGVRIAMSVGKTFAWTLERPLYTCSSLALMASAHRGLVMPWVDARRGNAFTGLYHVDDETMEARDKEQHVHLDTYQSGLPEAVKDVTSGRPDFKKVLNGGLLTQEESIHAVAPRYLRTTEAARKHGKEL